LFPLTPTVRERGNLNKLPTVREKKRIRRKNQGKREFSPWPQDVPGPFGDQAKGVKVGLNRLPRVIVCQGGGSGGEGEKGGRKVDPAENLNPVRTILGGLKRNSGRAKGGGGPGPRKPPLSSGERGAIFLKFKKRTIETGNLKKRTSYLCCQEIK